MLVSLATGGTTQWHYSLRDRLLLAYDPERKTPIGGVGPDGFFSADSWPKQRFDATIVAFDTHQPEWLAFSDGVFRFDPYRDEIDRVMTPAPPEKVTAAAAFYPSSDPGLEPQFAVVSGSRLRLVQRNRQTVLDIALEYKGPQFRHWRVAIAPEGTGYYVWYVPSDKAGKTFTTTSYLTKLDKSGRVLSRQAVPPLPSVPSQLHWAQVAAGLLVPLGPAAVVMGARAYVESDFNPLTMGSRFYVAAALAVLSALVCCMLAIGISRRYAFSWRRIATWGISGFLFGPAGVLLQFCMVEFPARQPCSSCGQPRVVNRTTCEHCSSAFPAPAPDGTEVFA